MAVVSNPKQWLVAVDTNVLMDMADERESTLAAIEECSERPNVALIVPPTVVQELAYGVENWKPSERRVLAEKSLTCMLSWGMTPINFIPAGHGICQELARALIDRGLLPEEEKHDALVLAEAALCDASVLLTWDSHLNQIPPGDLTALLKDRHVGMLIIKSPATINSLFGKRK